MRFGYPIAATEENWLHDTLVGAVTRIHEIIAANDNMPAWPQLLPQDRHDALESKHGLKSKLAAYMEAASKLNPEQRQRVTNAMTQQNRIAELLAGQADCECITDLPAVIQKPVKELFEAGFDLLTPLGIRDDHYRIIWDAISSKTCPFCCNEPLEAPGLPRPDLDHMLARSDYPFAAANLWNLMPMGLLCNQRYKGQQNLLFDKEGTRRRAFYAYGAIEIQFSLANSTPFLGEREQVPFWQIDFVPDTEECRTWDAVFRVRERFRLNVLDPEYVRWVDDFVRWFARAKGQRAADQPTIAAALEEFAGNEAIQGNEAREFLRVLTYKMLQRHCAEGHERLLEDLCWKIQNTPLLAQN